MASETESKIEPKAAPPSPALSSSEIFHGLPSGFSDLAQHNNTMMAPYPHDQLPMESFHNQSQPVSRYSTPIPQAIPYQQHLAYAGGHFNYQHHMPAHDMSPYGPLPDEIQAPSGPPYGTPVTSPPTPSRASDVITTRSGANIRRASTMKTLAPKSSRVEKPPPKKKERVKAARRIPKLDGPMSELTKDSPVPVVDIEAYVNRSTEERRKEVADGKVPGKIKRPMNAFMLYRKAYQNRAKNWCSQHNHQVVSQVCGDSWPLEPEHIRLQFNEWAKMERDNHQKAHPGYKFTPSKPQKSKLRKDSEEPEPSEAGDFDWDSRPTGSTRDRSRTKTPLAESDDDYQPPRSVYHRQTYATRGPARAAMPPQNRSTFYYTNPGKPMPLPYDPRELPGHYYQTTHLRDPQRQPVHGAVEDVMMRKTASPGSAFHHQQQPQAGPGLEFMDYPQPQYAGPPHSQLLDIDRHIDPSLLADGLPYDPNMARYGLGDYVSDPQLKWEPAYFGMPDDQFAVGRVGLDETLLQDRQTQLLKGTEDSWRVESLEPSQFDNWADVHPGEK